MRLRVLKMFLAGWVLASVLFAVGCSKISQENYNQLKIGMSYDEVVTVLGSPGECNSAVGLKNCRWGNKQKHIDVQFAGQKVVFYSAEGLK